MQSKSRLIRGRRPLRGDKTREMLSCESGKRERSLLVAPTMDTRAVLCYCGKSVESVRNM
jgi:hypothetical protein